MGFSKAREEGEAMLTNSYSRYQWTKSGTQVPYRMRRPLMVGAAPQHLALHRRITIYMRTC
jgi:hypothetical protein